MTLVISSSCIWIEIVKSNRHSKPVDKENIYNVPQYIILKRERMKTRLKCSCDIANIDVKFININIHMYMLETIPTV